jgi:hypothetical protein
MLWRAPTRRAEHGVHARDLSAARPATKGCNPFGTLGSRLRERQVKQRDALAQAAASADSDQRFGVVELESLHQYARTENLCGEGQLETILEHGEEPDALLGVAIGIDGGFRDEAVQARCGELPRGGQRCNGSKPGLPDRRGAGGGPLAGTWHGLIPVEV